jgi:NADH-quinone oxidoreductase subunit L
VLPIHDFPWSWEHFTDGLFAHARGGAAAEHLPAIVTYGIAVVVAWAGFAVAWTLYKPARNIAGDVAFERAMPRLRRALVNKLYVDEIYHFLVVRPLWRTAKVLWRVVDAALIDGLFVNGTAQFVAAIGALGRRFQNGNVQRYAAVTALGVAALVYLLLVRT